MQTCHLQVCVGTQMHKSTMISQEATQYLPQSLQRACSAETPASRRLPVQAFKDWWSCRILFVSGSQSGTAGRTVS